MTEAEIAAAFFVTPQVVKQRLRLSKADQKSIRGIDCPPNGGVVA